MMQSDASVEILSKRYENLLRKDGLRYCLNFDYAIREFIHDVKYGRKKTVVYCVDSVDVRAFCQGDENSHREYVFGGLLGDPNISSSVSGDGESLFLADAVFLDSLFLAEHDKVLVTAVAPHVEEIKVLSAEIYRNTVSAFSVLEEIVGRLSVERIQRSNLNNLKNYITSGDNLEGSFDRFLKEFNLVLPHGYLSFLNNSLGARKKYRDFLNGPSIKSLSSPGGGILRSLEIGENIGEFFREKSVQVKISKHLDEMREHLRCVVSGNAEGRGLTGGLMRDLEAVSIVASYNKIFEEYEMDIEFRMLSRSARLLSLASIGAVQGCTVVHPFFCIENYGARKLPDKTVSKRESDWRREVLKRTEDCYEGVRGVLVPVIDGIELDSSESSSTLLELREELEGATSALAVSLSGITLSALAEDIDPESKEHAAFRSRFSDNVSSEEVSDFFKVIGELLDSSSYKRAIESELRSAEYDYFRHAVSEYNQEHCKYFVIESGDFLLLRFRWGHMRPVFVFSNPMIIEVLKSKVVESDSINLDSWMEGTESARLLYQAIFHIDIELVSEHEKDQFEEERSLFNGILLASMGHFAMAAQMIGRAIGVLESENIESLQNVQDLVRKRELLMLRHFCARAAAFDESLYFKSGDKNFSRARRDLHWVYQIQNQIVSRLTDDPSSFSIERRKIDHIYVDPRPDLCGAASYLEVFTSWQKAVRNDRRGGGRAGRVNGNREITKLRRQKNMWGLSSVFRQITRCEQELDLGDIFGRYYKTRVNQLKLTLFLVVLCDKKSAICRKAFSLESSPHRNDYLGLADYCRWMSEVKDFQEKGSRLVTIRIIEPVVNLLEEYKAARCEYRGIKLGGIEHRGIIIRLKESNVAARKKVQGFMSRTSGQRLRVGGFYYNLAESLVDVLNANIVLLSEDLDQLRRG